MNILVKYPTRGRSGIFLERLKQWYDAATEKGAIRWIVTYDEDDVTMQYSVLAEAHAIIPTLVSYKGNCKTKIEACNANIPLDLEWDVLLLISDDMVCRRIGWDNMIRENMQAHFPDTDGCLWFHDGSKQRAICTLSCIGRKYYNRFHYIYHPSYCSFFCDNEFTEVAQQANQIVFIEQCIATHEHPAWCGGMKVDATYRKNNKYWGQDQALYNQRKRDGYPR